jgi:hypothetical protein
MPASWRGATGDHSREEVTCHTFNPTVRGCITSKQARCRSYSCTSFPATELRSDPALQPTISLHRLQRARLSPIGRTEGTVGVFARNAVDDRRLLGVRKAHHGMPRLAFDARFRPDYLRMALS